MPHAPFRLGWEEWVALPDLRLPALKVKVDTGARTSALHASEIEPFGSASAPRIKFLVHPVPRRPTLAVACSAPISDRREVTSSNGETELRYVIETRLVVGDRGWPVELTLTDRGSMAYRMLLGRQAFPDDAVVVPNESFCQMRLGYDAYDDHARHGAGAERPLRIALLGKWRGRPARALIAHGTGRGHEVETIDPGRCTLAIDGLTPAIVMDGQRVTRFDAVLARLGGASAAYGTAVLRQFEATGAWCANSAAGILSARDGPQSHQALARRNIQMPATVVAPVSQVDAVRAAGRTGPPWAVRPRLPGATGEILADTDAALRLALAAFQSGGAVVQNAAGEGIRCLVAGNRVIATAWRHDPGAIATRADTAERALAKKAARAFGLNLLAVDLLRSDEGPKVCGVDPCPDLTSLDPAGLSALAKALIGTIEARCRTRIRRSPDARRAGR